MEGDKPNGDGYARSFERRLDRMNDTIQALTDSILVALKIATERHKLVMEEINGLIELQREHPVDIMALFASSKQMQERLDQLKERK